MKLQDLLSMLNDLPVAHLQTEIYIEDNDETAYGGEFFMEPVTATHDDHVIIGYVMGKGKQMELPFEYEPEKVQ